MAFSRWKLLGAFDAWRNRHERHATEFADNWLHLLSNPYRTEWRLLQGNLVGLWMEVSFVRLNQRELSRVYLMCDVPWILPFRFCLWVADLEWFVYWVVRLLAFLCDLFEHVRCWQINRSHCMSDLHFCMFLCCDQIGVSLLAYFPF